MRHAVLLTLLLCPGAGLTAESTYTNPVSDTPLHMGDRVEFTAEGKLRVKGRTRAPQPLPSSRVRPPALAHL